MTITSNVTVTMTFNVPVAVAIAVKVTAPTVATTWPTTRAHVTAGHVQDIAVQTATIANYLQAFSLPTCARTSTATGCT